MEPFKKGLGFKKGYGINKGIGTAFLLLLLFIGGCGREAAVTKSPAVVGVTEAKMSEPDEESELAALLQAQEEAVLSFELSGRIAGEIKEAGTKVKKGEVLAAISPEIYQRQAEAAQAQLQEAQAALVLVQAGARKEEIRQAEAALNQAKEHYESVRREYERMKSVYEAGGISEADFQKIETNLHVAEQQVIQAEAAYRMAVEGAREEQIEQAAAKVNQAAAQVQLAKEQLQKTKLTAPFAGVVLEKLASSGELVSPGRPVVRLGVLDALKVMVPVPAGEVSQWKVGGEVLIANGAEERRGRIVRVAPATNPGSGTVPVEVRIENPEHDWLPGQAVTVKIGIKGKRGIYLPAAAVIHRGGDRPFVFVVENGTAHQRPVTVEQIAGDRLLVSSGLHEGEKVVVRGANLLTDGEQVTVEEVDIP